MPPSDRRDPVPEAGLVAISTVPAAYGGLEKVVTELVHGLQARGRPLLLLVVLEPTTAEPAWVRELRDTGATVLVLRHGGRSYGSEFRSIGRVLREHRVSVLHTHGYRADLIHALAARGAGIPVVSTVHGFTGRGMRGRFYEWLQCRALRSVKAVVAVSRPLADELTARGVPSARLHLLPNAVAPVAPMDSAPARRALDLPPRGPIVGWVGRMSAEKGPDVMVQAMASLRPDVTLCMVGDGPVLAATRALAASLGLQERIRFAGAVPAAGALLRAFDVLALSSRTEGTPMVVLEAAAAGVPVVATAVGGVPDLLGSDAASLVSAGDPGALGAAIAQVLSDPASAAERASQLADRLAASHDPVRWAAAYDALYGAVTAR